MEKNNSINIEAVKHLIDIIYFQIDTNFIYSNNTIYENYLICEKRLNKFVKNKLLNVMLLIIFLSKIKTIGNENNTYKNVFLQDLKEINEKYNFKNSIIKFIQDNGYKYEEVFDYLSKYYRYYEQLKYFNTSNKIKKIEEYKKDNNLYLLLYLYIALNPHILYDEKTKKIDIENSINSYHYLKNVLNDKIFFEKTLIIVRGLSGSGKSSLSNIIGDISISYDMYSEIEDGNYKKMTSKEYKLAKKYIYDWIENSMKQGIKKIVVNNQFLKYKSIENFVNLAKKYGYKYFLIIVENINNTKNIHGVTENELLKYKKNFEFKI